GPGCVKTHASAKCRKYNSPTWYRAKSAQNELASCCAISPRCFYVRGGRCRFPAAKALTGLTAMSDLCPLSCVEDDWICSVRDCNTQPSSDPFQRYACSSMFIGNLTLMSIAKMLSGFHIDLVLVTGPA